MQRRANAKPLSDSSIAKVFVNKHNWLPVCADGENWSENDEKESNTNLTTTLHPKSSPLDFHQKPAKIRLKPISGQTLASQTIAKVDANNHRRTMVYDALGRERAQIDPLGYRTTNVFNAAGQTISQIDARGNRHSFTYNAAGAQTQQIDALGRRTTLGYDAAGQQTLRLDARGNRTTYVYDATSQLVERRYPDGSRATFAYNPTGQRTYMFNGVGTQDTFAYDSLGQMIVTQGNFLTVTFSYDAIGNRQTRYISPTLTVTYVYNGGDQLSEIQDEQNGRTTYAYDAASQRVSTRFPNGTRCSQSYDASQRITQVHSRTSSGSAIVTYDYQYDAEANRIAVVEANGDRVSWSYDAADRLLSERRSGANSYAHTFSYDAVGNRLILKADSARTTFNYDIANQLNFSINSTGRTTFGYDASGNQLREIGPSGTRTTTSWDYENQPSLYNLGASRVTMAYNADQRRIIKNTPVDTSAYVWDLVYDTYLFRYQEPGPKSASIYTNEPAHFGRLVSESRLFGVGSGTNIFHTDALGSVRAITNSSQTTLNTYDYGAWGRDVAASESIPNEFRWVGIYGYYYDSEIGLYYIRARTYQPTIARWTSVDPLFYMLARSGIIGLGSKERSRRNATRLFPIITDEFNQKDVVRFGGNRLHGRFEYALGNPLTYNDPSGLVVWRHHWIPIAKSGVFSAKCGAALLAAGVNISDFVDSITTPFDPGWGPEPSIHVYLHGPYDYQRQFEQAVGRAKDCCSLLWELHFLIPQALLSAYVHFEKEKISDPSKTYPDVSSYLPFPRMEHYDVPHSSTDGVLTSVTKKVCCPGRRRNLRLSPFPVPSPVPEPIKELIEFMDQILILSKCCE